MASDDVGVKAGVTNILVVVPLYTYRSCGRTRLRLALWKHARLEYLNI